MHKSSGTLFSALSSKWQPRVVSSHLVIPHHRRDGPSELSRSSRKRRKSRSIVRIGETLPGETLARKEKDGPDGERARVVFGAASSLRSVGGIYEIAGHPTSTVVNPGDRWAAALMYMRVLRGGKDRERSVYGAWREKDALARACRAQDTPGKPGEFRGRGRILEVPRPGRDWPPT